MVNGTLGRRGACGEDDARRSVWTSIRNGRRGLARKLRHDPSFPNLEPRGSRANTNAGTHVPNRRELMVMSIAYASVRARCMAL